MIQQTSSARPKTTLGKWSVWLVIVMLILFLVGSSLTDTLYDSVLSGDTILLDISGRPALALSMLAGMVAGTAAFITGLLAIFKQKDRTLLVYVSTLIGGLLVVFLVLEILFPN